MANDLFCNGDDDDDEDDFVGADKITDKQPSSMNTHTHTHRQWHRIKYEHDTSDRGKKQNIKLKNRMQDIKHLTLKWTVKFKLNLSMYNK